MIRWSIHQEYITIVNIVNIYVPNTGACKYIKEILKGKLENYTIIVGDFNISLSKWIGHPDRDVVCAQQYRQNYRL